jgi:two-component system phosphate regulon sensor histidine kinase PhoR
VAQNLQQLGYRRIVQLLVYLVIIPTVLVLATGIVLMFVGERANLVLGILTVSIVAVMVTGVVLVLVFLQREASLSQLQADFVSKVSHELRTPLTAIRLFAETLQRSDGNPETTRKCVEMLNAETERLTRRIERLLDWGRMEAGRRLYDLQEDGVKEIVDEAVAQFSPFRYREDVKFTCDVEAGLPKVLADRAALIDALTNLLSNANKYGGVPPEIRLRAFKSSKGEICISVSDNGQGIAHTEQRRIFEKFYRVDDRLSREREGSGLGLAIVKHVVRAHNGRISVESAKGRGSTFSITLPPAKHIPLSSTAPTEVKASP